METLSELAVPVVVDGEVISVIDVQSFKAGDFGDDDTRLLEILGQHVASAFRWMKADSN